MDYFPLISFFMGVVSILSPCILPIIPILFGFSLNKSTKELLSFILGIFSIFTLVIFLTVSFTVIIFKYINYFRLIAALILFALSLVILFDKQFINFNFLKPINKKGLFADFLLGVLTSLAWAPCYGPYLISLITFLTSSKDLFYPAINIIIYALGFVSTLLILGVLISKINIEKLLKASVRIKNIIGSLILISSLYMLYQVLGVFL